MQQASIIIQTYTWHNITLSCGIACTCMFNLNRLQPLTVVDTPMLHPDECLGIVTGEFTDQFLIPICSDPISSLHRPMCLCIYSVFFLHSE